MYWQYSKEFDIMIQAKFIKSYSRFFCSGLTSFISSLFASQCTDSNNVGWCTITLSIDLGWISLCSSCWVCDRRKVRFEPTIGRFIHQELDKCTRWHYFAGKGGEVAGLWSSVKRTNKTRGKKKKRNASTLIRQPHLLLLLPPSSFSLLTKISVFKRNTIARASCTTHSGSDPSCLWCHWCA